MDRARENDLEVMVKIESIKCANWLVFEYFSLFPSSKSHNLII